MMARELCSSSPSFPLLQHWARRESLNCESKARSVVCYVTRVPTDLFLMRPGSQLFSTSSSSVSEYCVLICMRGYICLCRLCVSKGVVVTIEHMDAVCIRCSGDDACIIAFGLKHRYTLAGEGESPSQHENNKNSYRTTTNPLHATIPDYFPVERRGGLL